MSDHKLPEWIYVPELEETIVESDNLGDFLENNKILLNILDNINEGLSILKPNLDIIYLNKTVSLWYGSDELEEEIKCYELFHGRKSPCEGCPVKTSLNDGKPHQGKVPYKDSDDNLGEMHIHVSPILNSKKETVFLLEYIQNISFQKQMRDSYEDIESQLSLVEANNKLLIKTLTEMERDYQELEKTINENLENYVRPAMKYLKKRISEKDYQRISFIIEYSFKSITNENVEIINNLTPQEMKVAGMIKEGYSSKEIADKLFVTKKTVDYHRANIRKKLNLDSNTNLQSYLDMHLKD